MALNIIPNINNKDEFIKNIYLNKMVFYFIFVLPNEYTLNINNVKNSIKNIHKDFLFEIIQKSDLNEIEKFIKSKNINSKVNVKIFISENAVEPRRISIFLNKKNDFFYFLDKNSVNIPFLEIITKEFNISIKIYILMNFIKTTKVIFLTLKKIKKYYAKKI